MNNIFTKGFCLKFEITLLAGQIQQIILLVESHQSPVNVVGHFMGLPFTKPVHTPVAGPPFTPKNLNRRNFKQFFEILKSYRKFVMFCLLSRIPMILLSSQG